MMWRVYLWLRRHYRLILTDLEAETLPLPGEDEADAIGRRAW